MTGLRFSHMVLRLQPPTRVQELDRTCRRLRSKFIPYGPIRAWDWQLSGHDALVIWGTGVFCPFWGGSRDHRLGLSLAGSVA